MADIKKLYENLDVIQKLVIFLVHLINQPIPGKLWLQKELFLIAKNIPKLQEEIDYSPHLKGPFSESIDEALEDLQKTDVLVIRGKYDGDIDLSNTGKELAVKIKSEIPSDVAKMMEDIKYFLNDLSEKELLAYIYFSFPEMTEESVLFEKIKDSRYQIALSLYSKGKISIGKASEIAGVSQEEFMRELKKRGIKVFED